MSRNLYLALKFGTGKVFGTRKLILDSDFENFQIGVSYSAMSSVQKSLKKKHKNWCEISKKIYLALKFDTGKVFGARKLISDSDFENFQIGVSYTMQYLQIKNHQKKNIKIGVKSQKTWPEIWHRQGFWDKKADFGLRFQKLSNWRELQCNVFKTKVIEKTENWFKISTDLHLT